MIVPPRSLKKSRRSRRSHTKNRVSTKKVVRKGSLW